MTIQAALASVLVLAAFSAGHPVMGQQNEDCMACHSDGLMGAPRVDFKSHKASIHGRHLCISCHADAANLPHPEKLAPVSCKTCHRIESQIYMSSDHGQAVARGLSEAAACKDCHGRTHTLLNSRNPQSPVNRKNVPATCGRCHKDLKRMEKFKLSELQPVESYAHTVHGEAFAQGKINAAVCSDCHGSHDLHGAANSSSRIFWRNIPETCGRCHNNVLSVYQISIHGQATRAGIKEAPGCTSCHGEHTIRSPKDPFSSSWTGAITKTCAGCHASETLTRKFGLPVDRLKTYMDTYHGLAYQRGDLMVANCASCHGFHDVLAHTDPRSSIYRSNLSNTCGKCHPGAGAQLAHGYVHGPPAANQHWSLRAATWFYLILIPLVLGGMMLHNGLDFVKKLLRSGPPHHDHPQDEMRLSLNERLQHGVLLLVFFWLAYTGFALKYPETWWAYPLNFAAEDLRRSFHRWAALLFCLLGVYHAAYLAFSARGRNVLKSLLPMPGDVLEALRMLAFNAGLRRVPPHLSTPYNYIEKSEYWALIWGSVVMVISGGILVFSDFTLRHFPMWVSDLATAVHFYEAILACAAIAAWHFYWVIFDPDVYPMNWAWLTGFVKRRSKIR